MKPLLYACLLTLILPITGHAGTPGEIHAGQLLPNATLDGLNVDSRTLADYQGKPLLINVWASWCGPCRKEMPSLERLARKFNGKQFNLIGISTDDYRDRAEIFLKQTGATFDNFIDHKLVMENRLGASTIPLTVFVDADGRIIDKVSGTFQWDSAGAIKAIGGIFKVDLAP
jgi:thiol-disulfide isomerase/thioredoxin